MMNRNLIWLVILTAVCMPGSAFEPMLNAGAYELRFDFASYSGKNLYDNYKHGAAIQVDGHDYEIKRDVYNLDIRYGAAGHTTLILRTKWMDQSLDPQSGDSNLANWSMDGLASYFIGVQMRRSVGMYNEMLLKMGYEGDGSYNETEPFPIGGGDSGWLINMSYRFSLNPYSADMFFDLGYRFRDNNISDEWDVRTGLNYHFKGFSDLSFYYHAVESKDSLRPAFDPLVFPSERGFQKAGALFSFGLGKRLSFLAGYEKVINGRSVFDLGGFRTGVSYRF